MTTTVLVAGATGMLGSRIAAHLLDQTDVTVRLLPARGSPVRSRRSYLMRSAVAPKPTTGTCPPGSAALRSTN